MLQASETSKQAKTPHERSALGRSLISLRFQVKQWIAENQRKASPEAIEAAEKLYCELYCAAHNGLGVERATLLESIDNTERLLRRQSGNAL